MMTGSNTCLSWSAGLVAIVRFILYMIIYFASLISDLISFTQKPVQVDHVLACANFDRGGVNSQKPLGCDGRKLNPRTSQRWEARFMTTTPAWHSAQGGIPHSHPNPHRPKRLSCNELTGTRFLGRGQGHGLGKLYAATSRIALEQYVLCSPGVGQLTFLKDCLDLCLVEFQITFKYFFRCARAASLKNYTHFGIQGYGECWSGPAAGKTYLLDGVENRFSQRPSPKPWLGCVGDSFERCRGGSDKCVGQENTNFVYAVVNCKLFRVQRRYVVTLK